MWREKALNKIDELIDYIKYLGEVEDSEFDGTEEGYKIVVNHVNYQNIIINILEQIKKDYTLYSGYEDIEKEEDKKSFYEKFKVISYLLLIIDEYKVPAADKEYFKDLKNSIRYD